MQCGALYKGTGHYCFNCCDTIINKFVENDRTDHVFVNDIRDLK